MTDDDESGRGSGVSRRDFLRGGAAVGAVGALGTGLLNAVTTTDTAVRTEAGVAVIGPGPVPMTFTINGKEHKAQLEPRTTLLDALRDRFDLTGAKRVCDRGTCGACTVIANGRTIYACSVLAIEAQGAKIETVEGLGTPGALHPLQASFVQNDAQQCGFCTPGFVMAAKALLDHNPHPSLAEVHHGLSGNFCRCGTYMGLRQAVLDTASGAAAKGESHG